MTAERTVVEQASRWLMLQWQGGLNDEQNREFEAWLHADAEHRRVWHKLQDLQGLLAQPPAETARQVLAERPARQRRDTLKLLSLLLLAGGATLAYQRAPWREHLAMLRTAPGERRELRLEDGSRLWLNSDTALNLRYDDRQRLLELVSGEIFLASAADTREPSRPLRVATWHGLVEALGTRFAVYADRAMSRVRLEQGRLRVVNQAGRRQLLEAGQGLRFQTGWMDVPQAFAPSALAWREGKLIAERQPLGDFIEELGRHRRGLLRCAAELRGIPVTGVFHLDDQQAILAALEQSLPLRVRYLSRYWVSLEPR